MKNITKIFVLAGLILCMFSQSAWSASTKEEIQELKAQIANVQKDLYEIKKMLKEAQAAPARRAAPPVAAFKKQVVSIGNAPHMGDDDATLTLVEFSDYQCPYCARHYRDVMPKLKSEYIDTGKVKFVMRENPILSIHSKAMGASIAALCADDQGKYWEMHDIMFDNQRKLSEVNLKSYAEDIELDTAVFNDCLDNKKYEQQVNDDIKAGAALGVRGTPGFVLGTTDPKDSSKANMSVYLKGAKPYEDFKEAIDTLLGSAE